MFDNKNGNFEWLFKMFFFQFCVKRPKKCEEGKKLSHISDSEIYRNELDWTHGLCNAYRLRRHFQP